MEKTTSARSTCIIHRVQPALLLLIFLSSCLAGSQLPRDMTQAPGQTTFHIDKSALSYGVFETEASSLTVEVSNTSRKTFSDAADVSIEDGSGLTTYKIQPGESTIIHSMSAGKKRVVITSGGQIKYKNELTGVFIDKVTFDRSAVPLEQEGKRIVVYGDSLAVGGKVENPSAESWPVLLRKYYPVLVEAYGYRALHDDASTAQARTELASKILSERPDYIWLAIGANDYAFGLWSARDFGEAYAATLDAIHTLNPEVVLFAQSPILQVRETPNSFGDSLGDYRQQIADACSARPGWCVFVDGTDPAFPQPNELDSDGVHLTAESSAKYAEAVLQLLSK